MKIIRAVSLAIAILVPVAALASPAVRNAASCCGDCCPNCPDCPDCPCGSKR